MKSRWKRTPFTNEEIVKEKCFRCGEPASTQWQICSDGNKYRPLCLKCDVELNELVLRWMGFPDAKRKLAKYKESFEM